MYTDSVENKITKYWIFLVGLASLFLVIVVWQLVSGWQNWSKNFFNPNSTSVTLSPTLMAKPFVPTATPTQMPVKLLFTGDLMFDRKIRTAAEKFGNDYIFAALTDLFSQQQLVIVNLEGPITQAKSKSLGSVVGSPANYIFTFDPSLAETLKKHQIKLVNLGNNHILNFGEAGLTETLSYLDKAQINYFGQINPTQDQTKIAISKILTLNDQTIAFINYNQFSPGQPIPAVLTEISKLRSQVDWIIIYAHWDREYEVIALPATTKLAHQFIDAGADLIIGSHPHVTQNHEVYQGKEIYYSLGNFVFDQYFSPETQQGLLVSVKLEKLPKVLSTSLIPVELIKTGQTQKIDH